MHRLISPARFRGRLGVPAAVLVLTFAVQPTLADWPQFRGPDGQGHAGATGLPVTWDADTNVTWKAPLPGLAWSSPVIVQGRIYLTTAVESPSDAAGDGEAGTAAVTLAVLCLDAASGETKWRRDLFSHPVEVQMHKKNSHASPTPVVVDDQLYVHFGPQGTAALTLSGDLLWKQKLEYEPVHGNGGSPAVAGDLLILCCDGGDTQYVVGLDRATGEIRWRTDRDTSPSRGFSFSTPLVLEIEGRLQAICPGSDAVFAYDPATGAELWRVTYPGGYSVIPRPVFGQGLVFVCTGYSRPTLLAIDPTGSGDVTKTHVRWQTDSQVPHSASLLLVDDLLFFVSDRGIARCVEARTGDTHWEQRLGGNFSASPMYAEGRVYFQDETGTATVIDASRTYQEIARNRLPPEERTFASYAVTDSALFLRSEGHLYRIEMPRQSAGR